ncbi:MAG: DUF1259 domain-containing protein [Gemmatimonadaceae bacterium]
MPSNRLALVLAFFSASALPGVAATAQQPAWSAVENALGRNGIPQAGNVMRFNFPRTDLTVRVRGVPLAPAFALGGWVAFLPIGGGQVMAMGDLVLLDSEVSAAMSALQAGGVEQSALHNHLLNESPHVMYLHVSAHGDPLVIATAIRAALVTSATPLGALRPAAAPSAVALDTAGIAHALGVAGRLNGAVYQVSIARSETIVEMGQQLPPSMGVATAINFQPTGRGKAAVTGDFVLRGSEVNPVIRALKKNAIDVTALHSHLIDEEPRLYFMHFWANDDAVKLARGLREALDQAKSSH